MVNVNNFQLFEASLKASPEIMNPRYVQTFSRHRLLFSLPLVLTTLLALWFVLATPKAYEAKASLWVDTPPPGASSLDQTNTALLSPAAQSQQLLSELLTTKQFRLAIGHRGPLAQYFKTHPSQGWGPKALLTKLRGSRSVDDRTAAALDPAHVMTTVAGPQVLAVQLRGPTPVAAVGTLQALVSSFNHERRALDVRRQQIAMAHFKNQMDAASATVTAVQGKLANYASTPGASNVGRQGLIQAQRGAETRLTNATRGYNQASLSLAVAGAEKNSFQVIDPPKLPAPAVGGLKKSGFSVVAGLFVGALVSFLAIVLFSGADSGTSEAEQAEIRDAVMRSERDAVPAEPTSGANGASTAADRPSTAKAESGGG